MVKEAQANKTDEGGDDAARNGPCIALVVAYIHRVTPEVEGVTRDVSVGREARKERPV